MRIEMRSRGVELPEADGAKLLAALEGLEFDMPGVTS